MKKQGIIHAQLAGLLAGLGHMDTFMIADAGMPIPQGVEIVDLALCEGIPTFRQVMDAVLCEEQIEGYILAKEIQDNNPKLLARIQEKFLGLPCEMVSHAELKKISVNIKFAIRTGEFTPYSNIILRSGVVF